MVAVDGAHIYWANYNDGTIGRANLNSTGVDQGFINTGGFGVEGVAVDSGHIYWTHLSASSPIGRANINGTGIEPSFITGANYPDGVAVDATYIYWANTGGNIGRALLNGSSVNQDFITTTEPCGVAVDGGHVYWTLNNTGEIARADLNGTEINESFITGAPGPCGIAVDSLPQIAPNTKITKARVSQAKHQATFRFKALGTATRFQCKLVRGHHKARFRACGSPHAYKHLKPGRYIFEVRAVGPGGADPTPAKRRFKIT